MLSTCYKEILLFQFDDRTGDVFILAGEEIQILVFANGDWRFIDAT
jgi:hypothetical protein